MYVNLSILTGTQYLQGWVPGTSWSLTICLSLKSDRLWISWNEWLVWQLRHSVGSAMRPRSISTISVERQMWHWKKASRISGKIPDVRITIPAMVMSWSISSGLSERILVVFDALNGRTCTHKEIIYMTFSSKNFHISKILSKSQ